MNTYKTFRKVLAMTLSVVMVLGMVPMTAFAKQTDSGLGASGEIIAFVALQSETAKQMVSLGTSLEDLDLPDTLTATVRFEAEAEITTPADGAESSVADLDESAQDIEYTEPDDSIFSEDEEVATVSNAQKGTDVTTELTIPVLAAWTAEPDYDGDTEGTYTFTAEIEGFTISAELPIITVTVGEVAVLGEIIAFAQLPEGVRFQRGSTPNLPEKLESTVNGETIQIPITWESETDEAQSGLHVFSSKVGAGYTIAEGVSAPTIAFVRTSLGRMGGLGTQAIPLQITNAAQLAEIAALVNAGKLEETVLGIDTATVYLKLMNNIDLSGYGAVNTALNSGKGWTPIGNDFYHPFTGHFDGNGYVIAGLYINDNALDKAGLFGHIFSGKVVHLGVVNVDITGGEWVGGVAGEVNENGGIIENCYTTGTVSGVKGVGGVTGSANNNAIVRNCYSTARVENTGINFAGGIAGWIGNGSTLQNCAALNSSISGPLPVGRVVGLSNSSNILSDNIAFSGMTVNGVTVFGTATDKNGEDKTAADITAAGFFEALFANDTAWTYALGELPRFRAAVEMLGHINDNGYFFAGLGTISDPFQIATAAELAKLADVINNDSANTTYNDNTVHYQLTADIDLSGYGAANTAFNGGKGWVPIGEESMKSFKGQFDGNGKVVTGLYINDTGRDIVGLFGYVFNGGVQNLGLVNVDITGGNSVGGVLGAIFNGKVENCYVTGSVIGNELVGGLAGSVRNTTVKNSYSATNVTGNKSIGGMVGSISTGTVENCYSTGSVVGNQSVGGLAGYVATDASVKNCAALNPSVGKDVTATSVGRVVGINYGTSNLSGNVAFDGMLVHSYFVNGTTVIGTATDEHGEDKTATEMQTSGGFPSVFTALPWSYITGRLPVLNNRSGQDATMLPHLLPAGSHPFSGGNGVNGNPYRITTAAQLAWLAERVNARDTAYNNKWYSLNANIDLTAYGAGWNDGKGWVPIGDGTNPFKGQFDGNRKTVTGLYINDNSRDYVGLFGIIDANAVVLNLGVVSADISGKNLVGGVAGTVAGGTIRSCYVTGNITGNDEVGGVAGRVMHSGLIQNSYATGSVAGNDDVGGVAGRVIPGNSGYVSKVENCYATGSVTGNGNVGGVAGGVTDGMVTNCVALNPSVTATSNYAGRVVGYKNGTVTVSKCYAYRGMVCENKGSDYDNGTAVGTANDIYFTTFWTAPSNWNTSGWDTNLWNIQSGKLPILKSAGGDQTGDAGMYLTSKSIENATVTVNGTCIYNGIRQAPSITVTFGGKILDGNDYTIFVLGGSNDGIYAGTPSFRIVGAGDYTGETAPKTYTILPKPITITGVTATDRPYDGTTSVTLSGGTLVDVEIGDTAGVSAVLGSGTIANANIGSNKPVTTGITLSGSKASNYSLTQPTGLTASITKKELDVTVTADDKSYDGNANATVTATINSGVVASEDVMINITGAAFSDENAGNNKPVSYSWDLTGADAGNYSLPTTKPMLTANIAPADYTYTVAGTQNIKVGSGLTAITVAPATGIDVNGEIVSGNLTWHTASSSGPAAQDSDLSLASVSNTITLFWSYTATNANYTTTAKTGLTIFTIVEGDPQTITFPTVTGGAVSKTYGDANFTHAANLSVGGGTVSYSSSTPAVAMVNAATGEMTILKPGTTTITATAAAVPGQWEQANVSYTLTISKATITITADNQSAYVATAEPAYTYQVSGLAMGEALQMGPTVICPTANMSEVGIYPIVASGAIVPNTNNYESGIIYVNGTLTVSTNNGNGSSGRSGSSSGGGSAGGWTIETGKNTNLPTTATQTLTSKPVQNGNLAMTITKKMVEDGIAAAKGKWTGRESYGIALNFQNTADGTKNLKANIEVAALDHLVSQGVKSLTIQCGIYRITLDEKAIKSLDTQSTGNVIVSVMPYKVSDTVAAVIGNRPVFEITFKDANGKEINDFGSGTITRGVKYSAVSGEKSDSLFIVKVTDGNQVEWIDKSSYDNGWMIWSSNSNSVYGVGYKTATTFTDIASHWAKDNIDFVVSRGLISGSTETTFAPNTAITRADFLMALGKLSGADVSSYKTSSFTDVTSADVALPYIEWAVANDIVQGIGNSQFGPNQQITREQMAVMMENYAKTANVTLPASSQYNAFADDSKINSWAKDAVKVIAQAGIIIGKDGNQFDPQGNATRAEASTILRRFVELVID